MLEVTNAVHVISSPCQFSHSFESENLCILQMSSNSGDSAHYDDAGPFQHYFYAVIVPISQTTDPRIRRWKILPEDVAALLSLFYGKRILHHGFMYLPPVWGLPELQSVRPNPYYTLELYAGIHTKEPRREPDWREANHVARLLQQLSSASNGCKKILVAARAYADSLRLLPFDRELAYFRLIQAIESMVDSSEFTESERFSQDSALLKHLQWLDNLDDPHGKETASFMRNRLYQVKRGVWLWLSDRVDMGFYSKETGALKGDNLQRVLSAAYDLRSMYVHTGQRFGDWVDPIQGRCECYETIPEWMEGTCPNKDLWKILKRAPSYLGLARLTRYALMKTFASDVKE
jgi:hypothetical protein